MLVYGVVYRSPNPRTFAEPEVCTRATNPHVNQIKNAEPSALYEPKINQNKPCFEHGSGWFIFALCWFIDAVNRVYLGLNWVFLVFFGLPVNGLN